MTTVPQWPYLDAETRIGEADEAIERWQVLTPDSPYVWGEVGQTDHDDEPGNGSDHEGVRDRFVPDTRQWSS